MIKIIIYFKKSVFNIKTRTILNLRFIRFANNGLSFLDKYNSYLLRVAMDNPFSDRPALVKDKIFKSGSKLKIRHKYFNYMTLIFDLIDNFEMAICKEFFLENTYDLKLLQFEPATIIDCGGYRGYFSFIAAQAFENANIVCIEANPLNYFKIKESIESNKLDKISLLNRAVSAFPGKVSLDFDGSNSMINKGLNPKYKTTIDTVSLYEFINHENLLLKVDIEGAELDFFPDIISMLPKVCGVFLEIHDGWQSLSNIKKEFELNGFSFTILRERNQFIDSFAQRV